MEKNSILEIKSFKVPKLKSKQILECVNVKSNQFKTDIYQKMMDSFIKPKQSESFFNFVDAWLINHTEAQNQYINRRSFMRKENPNISESIGFIYINSKDSLIDLANTGNLRIGNISNSFLGTGSLGVSVCQHADIYHPGGSDCSVPKYGFIVVCKYMKGRIKYVPFNPLPMEPQPQYDCHMLKVNNLDNYTNIFNAFHKTQVFIYEYNEDGEIIECPTQILPFAAVEFNWYGDYIYRISDVSNTKSKSSSDEKNMKRISRKETKKQVNIHNNHVKPTEKDSEHVKNSQTKRLSRFESTDNSIHKLKSTFSYPCQLVVSDFQSKNSIEMKIICTVYMYMINPAVFPQLYSSQWYITDIIETYEFEKELKIFQFHLQDKISKSQTELMDPLSYDIIVSENSPTLLTSSENTINESFLFSNDTTIPKYVTYLRLVPDNSKQSRSNASKLIDHFNNSKTVARISLGFIDKQYKTMMFIFPDGKFSQKLGIPIPKCDECYFHGVLLHFQHPEFTICHLDDTSCNEKTIYFNGLSSYRKQSVVAKFNSGNSLIDISTLKETCNQQANIQKNFFKHLLKPNNKELFTLKYPSISSENRVEHSTTDIELTEIRNIDVTSNSTSTLSPDIVESLNNNNNHNNNNDNNNTPRTKRKLTKNGQISSKTKSLKQINKEKVKKIKKPVIPEKKAKDLKEKLLDILKNSSGILENRSSDNEENVSDSVTIDELNESNIESHSDYFDENDLVPLRKDIAFDISNNGSFKELFFLNQCSANIGKSNRIWYVHEPVCQYVKRPAEFQKMWALNRFIFRKVKNFTGLSFYNG